MQTLCISHAKDFCTYQVPLSAICMHWKGKLKLQKHMSIYSQHNKLQYIRYNRFCFYCEFGYLFCVLKWDISWCLDNCMLFSTGDKVEASTGHNCRYLLPTLNTGLWLVLRKFKIMSVGGASYAEWWKRCHDIWVFPKCFPWIQEIQWQKYLLLQ